MYDFITIVSFTKNASHTFYFSLCLNVEINVDVLASGYEKLTLIRKDEYDRVSY